MVTNSPHLLKGQNTTDNIIYTDRGSISALTSDGAPFANADF